MNRVSHDLPGVTQRIAKLTDAYRVATDELLEQWPDAKGRSFVQKYTTEIPPAINQLVAGMAQSAELFESITRQLQDPDHH